MSILLSIRIFTPAFIINLYIKDLDQFYNEFADFWIFYHGKIVCFNL